MLPLYYKGCCDVTRGAMMLQGVQRCYKGCRDVTKGAVMLQGVP